MNQNRNSHSSSRMTAQDVASLAGVSQSTVSRVFNPKWKGKVKPEIRERVLKIATETGYTPNTIAHILTSKRSGIVGVLVSKQYQAFYYAVLSEITACLNANGFQTMLFLTDPKDAIDDLFTDVLRYQLDGIIITSAAATHDLYQSKTDFPIPAVLYNGYVPGLSISAVHSDNYAGCIQMADYLVSLGHRNFAYISTANSAYRNYAVRQEAFLHGLSMHGIHSCKIEEADYSYESGAEAAYRLLTSAHAPDAIFCSGDINTMGARDAARKLGRDNGARLTIAGFDARWGMELPPYGITALRQDTGQLTRDAVQILKRMIDTDDRSPVVVTRPMELVVRTSTRPHPTEK